jgi:hypothetical protein
VYQQVGAHDQSLVLVVCGMIMRPRLGTLTRWTEIARISGNGYPMSAGVLMPLINVGGLVIIDRYLSPGLPFAPSIFEFADTSPGQLKEKNSLPSDVFLSDPP